MSQDFIECIFKDSRGYMWFGTMGLSRFDSYNFINYKPEKERNSISSTFVYDIAEDKKGNLWIATRNGLNKYDISKNEFRHYNLSQSEAKSIEYWINTLYFDKNNDLWIGTFNNAVQRITFDETYTEIRNIKNYLINSVTVQRSGENDVRSLYQDSEGKIWIGSFNGLSMLDPKTEKIKKFYTDSKQLYIPSYIVYCIYEDKFKNLWIGTDSGLFSLNKHRTKVKKYSVNNREENGISHQTVKAITEDAKGNLLVGTLGGLNILDRQSEKFSRFPDNKNDIYSLNNIFINDIFCDTNGEVWVGTDQGGVNKYNVFQKPFYFFEKEDDKGLNHNTVNSILEDNNYLWIGTAGGGLNRYDKKNKKFTYYTQSNSPGSISLNYVSSLLNDDKGEMWAATWGGGLNKVITQNGKTSFELYNNIPDSSQDIQYYSISGMLYDRNHNMWISNQKGVQILDRKTRKFHIVKPSKYGINMAGIGCMYLDRDNNMWMGSSLYGLFRLKWDKNKSISQLSNPDTLFLYSHDPLKPHSLGGNYITSIYQDNTGSLWFAVYRNGFDKLKKISEDGTYAEFTHFSTKDRLANSNIYGFLEDNRNNLWITTTNGLSVFNYLENNFTNYYEVDGLQSSHFYWSAYYKNKEGLMYIGGLKGLNYFYPDSIVSSPYLENVTITSFKVYNNTGTLDSQKLINFSNELPNGSTLVLDYNENNISFEYSALSYTAPAKIEYEYKLEGFEKQWIETDYKRRYVAYTNLSPGQYIFKVRATNVDGIWSPNYTSVYITILPPWWVTWWFRTIVVVLIFTMVYIFIKIRLARLYIKNKKLEELVSLRTSELKEANTNLNETNVLLEERQQHVEEQAEELKIINENLVEHQKQIEEQTEELKVTNSVLIEKQQFIEKQLKELKTTNKELSQLNLTKDKLFSILAHDLREPFNALLGYSELLLKNFEVYTKDKAKAQIVNIRDSAIYSFELLENLLSWSRTQRGIIELNPKSIHLEEYVENTIKTSRQQAERKEIDILVEYRGNSFLLNADPNMLSTIIRNLLNNAIKFSHKQGLINIIVDFKFNQVQFVIKDYGLGMNEETSKNLFNRDAYVSKPGTSGERGTGLGLHVCSEFIARHGGMIWLESTPGKGTTFYFSIPNNIIIEK